ncbi:hypothetical protein [Sphingobacterium bovistauri]|uniref:Uncharacterized protein n=1 Tax=Sphingobacterium bovistauri TaxID=2781959 RepID=A0ABS7Z6N3_9SPHI|nr:hypothetical protein [Sphingobacterium bovistauri]MCA5005217.1 hypothetical protein [Sphingobacterium bovistauri]
MNTRYILMGLLAIFLIGCSNPKSEIEKTEVVKKDTILRKSIDSVNTSKINELSPLEKIEKDNNENILSVGEQVNKAFIRLSEGDSLFKVYSSKYGEHRFYGFQKPDLKSKRMILFSIYTNDVDKNPFKMPYGAYYDISGMDDQGFKLKYVGTKGDFIEMKFIDATDIGGEPIFFEKKWIDIE